MVTNTDKMSGHPTRTILITTSSGNVPKLVTVNASAVEDIFSDDGGGPRKRRRLTNLTTEEKMLRRKLKNRVAAQTARDRKKELMGSLEHQITKLMEQNKRLQEENSKLKTHSSSLLQENQQLKERLGQTGSSVVSKSESLGSAVGTNSDIVTVDDAIRNLCSDNESLLSIVGQIDPQSETAAATGGCKTTILPSQRNCHTHTATSKVVGPTTAELESINELIKFDHVYYKHESSAVESGLEKLDQSTQSSNANLENKVNIHITQEITDDIEIDDIMKTEPDLCAINEIDETDLSDINMELLKDIENLIGIHDFQDQVEQNSLESFSQIEQCNDKQEAMVTKDTSCKTDLKRKRSDTSSPLSVMDMYESTDKYGQINSVLSDSGFSSDFSDVSSPCGSDISGGLTDNPWEESFMELFPTLA